MRRLSCQKNYHIVFWLEGATLARREWISLPYELAGERGSRLDPMSLRAECDHLVIELALRRLCRRTVITPRLASIPNFLLKAFLFFGSAKRYHQANVRHIVFPGHFQSTICPDAAFSFNLVRRHNLNLHMPVSIDKT
jgi:hypothetical protein